MKKLLFCIMMFFNLLTYGQQIKEQLKSYKIDQLEKLQKVEPRKVLIYVYASWCSYCKAMDQVVWRDTSIIRLLNRSVYFVKFDVEQQDVVFFNGAKYDFKASKGVHDFVLEITRSKHQIAYPMLVLWSEDYKPLIEYHSFLSAKELKEILLAYL
ncbi:thioredoxin family protein [Pedobacter sp. ASV28]|uniref:thioredoxin family protein n=1 Tax=Pedobacter sp. ASV28 TaxID=2795123 RepID=UPI0018ED48B4|nr:thioredoxin family protein [Pedobacter sp. ASV28]